MFIYYVISILIVPYNSRIHLLQIAYLPIIILTSELLSRIIGNTSDRKKKEKKIYGTNSSKTTY